MGLEWISAGFQDQYSTTKAAKVFHIFLKKNTTYFFSSFVTRKQVISISSIFSFFF